ncbi:hypothetical protein Dimus_026004 [Dionaea muscipula]
MALLDNEMNEGSIRSLLLDSLKSEQSGGAPSLEDVAWADSCVINKDSEASESDWDSLKDSLLEILDLQTQLNFSSMANDADMRATESEIIFQSIGNIEDAAGYSKGAPDDDDDDFMEDEAGSSGISTNHDHTDLSSKNPDGATCPKKRLVNAFRPDFRDELPAIGNTDLGFDPGFSVDDDSEVLPNDIFKVWDLGTSEEEDEFTKQLSKALAGISSPATTPSVHDDSLDLVNETVDDDITAGIAHLSLSLK